MNSIIRIPLIVSFTFLAALALGCGTAGSAKFNDQNANRPLKTPQVSGSRPKIIAFGDSLTAGFGLADKESYPYLLQQRLNADHYDYEVVNAGVSGDTTLGGLERSDWVLDQENAKIVVLELGANDLLRGMPVARAKEKPRENNQKGQGP
jgi:acyl-CoA thioesterase-1